MADNGGYKSGKQKPPEGDSSNSTFMTVDHAAINAGFA
jgi:hypothetical protein